MIELLARIIFFIVLFTFCKRVFYFYKKRALKAEAKKFRKTIDFSKKPLSRKEAIENLKIINFDICVIGGGATGVGCALDAASRGLRVALIEAGDFSSETSSKTTKLLHGGVRYLDKALKKFDISQFKLVGDALVERNSVMKIAPYLSKSVPFLLPIYKNIQIPYFWFALKIYDWLSKPYSLGRSYFIGYDETKKKFNNLKREGLVGSIVYYDGVMDDSRINVMLAVTAERYGATVANYIKLIKFNKNNEKIENAICEDQLTNEQFKINSKVFISATGAFTDLVRNKASKKNSIMVPSLGTHIVIKPRFGPKNMGLVDIETDDSRMMFLVPWKEYVVAGSTEISGEIQRMPNPLKKEIKFLMKEVQKYNDKTLKYSDVLSAWKGIRPLAKDGSENTENIVRRFELINDKNNLILLTGGKWTTYRLMAEAAIDMAIKEYKLISLRSCYTEFLPISGSENFTRDFYYTIIDQLKVSEIYAKHLQNHYGTNSLKLKPYLINYPNKISKKYLFTEAEVIYCADHEFALTIHDIVNNRFRIGFFDVFEAQKIGNVVCKILKNHFKWDSEKAVLEIQKFELILESFGLKVLSSLK